MQMDNIILSIFCHINYAAGIASHRIASHTKPLLSLVTSASHTSSNPFYYSDHVYALSDSEMPSPVTENPHLPQQPGLVYDSAVAVEWRDLEKKNKILVP